MGLRELFVEVYSYVGLDGVCEAPLETLIVLFLYKYCQQPPLMVTLVVTGKTEARLGFQVKFPDLLCEVVKERDLGDLAANSMLPVIITCEGTTCVAGLCAVLRQILKAADPYHSLLGFKQSCLYACAEASIWTKFCEVDVIEMVKEAFGDGDAVPRDLLRFERHMSEPVRVHNIQKQKQEWARARGWGPGGARDLEHVYSEGPEMTLADVIILPCVHLVVQRLGAALLEPLVPLATKWLSVMAASDLAVGCLAMLRDVTPQPPPGSYQVPDVPKQSLYKSDPKRYKPRHRVFTRQEDIDASLGIVREVNLAVGWEDATFGHDVPFDWNSVPFDAQPEGGQLPEKRLERKSQQLENLVKAVLKIARHGDRIVDFCSGSGHLGLILAHSLPRCSVVLLENKEESLARARLRATRLKLSNVVFCQSNIDYFRGTFDIGVALHACGVATDLVLERCLSRGAAFVACPCCYGSIQPNHMVGYPRSRAFTAAMSFRQYLVLGHGSDQTHDRKHFKTSQGEACMAAIDSDRVLRAREAGYHTSLSKLFPPTCTPKNNLLVGIPRCRQ